MPDNENTLVCECGKLNCVSTLPITFPEYYQLTRLSPDSNPDQTKRDWNKLVTVSGHTPKERGRKVFSFRKGPGNPVVVVVWTVEREEEPK